jgi:hypothetical protein
LIDLDAAQEVIQRGRQAADLLANEAFNRIVNDLTEAHLARLCAAPPGAKGADERDYNHLLQYALTEIVASLQGEAATGEAMQHALEESSDDDSDDLHTEDD